VLAFRHAAVLLLQEKYFFDVFIRAKTPLIVISINAVI
jgi:hypothetical protein